MRRQPLHRLLAALPALLILVGAPFANRVHGLVMGLPFLLFWIVACVLLTSVVMAIVGALDKRYEARARTAPAPSEEAGREPSR
jgi:hypothetical protein